MPDPTQGLPDPSATDLDAPASPLRSEPSVRANPDDPAVNGQDEDFRRRYLSDEHPSWCCCQRVCGGAM